MVLGALFIVLLILIVLGVPIAFALGIAALVAIMVDGSIPTLVVLHQVIGGIDSFPLLAIPFFILAGALMNEGGITKRIFEFAGAVVGSLRGGLGHVNVGASILFSGMSGAAVADAGGLGAIEIKAMRDKGYDADFAVGLTAASSTIGPIIPPSLPMIIYGVLAGVSIGQLFTAGIIPGLLMALSLSVMVGYFAKKRNYPKGKRFSFRDLKQSFVSACPSLLAPIIIIGGITSGLFTATEAAVVVCLYALLLSSMFYKTLSLNKLVRACIETIETSSSILLIIGCAAAFSWVLTSQGIHQIVADYLASVSSNKYLILLIFTLLLFVVGCFMETIAAITILTPILLPIAIAAGIDPVQFGVIMVFNLMLGLLTPPLGMVLFVLSQVSNVSIERCARATLPFLLPLGVVLLLIMFIPALTLWLPSQLF